MLKRTITIFLLVVSSHGYAAPGGWMPLAKKISQIHVEGDEANGKALIVIEGGVPTDYIPSECNSPYNTVLLTSEKGRGILSVALSAYMSGKPVKLALSCIGSRPLITNIQI